MLATPADFLSIMLAAAYALPCFLIGVVLASDLDATPRWALAIMFMIIAGLLATAIWSSLGPVFWVIATVVTIVNILLGVKACSNIVYHRRRIFGALSVAYAFGLLFGPVGAVILSVPAVLIANRDSSVDDER